MAGVVAALACTELGPGGRLRLEIEPVFSQPLFELLSGDLDRVHVVVTRLPAPPGGVVVDQTVPVDTAGNADLTVSVPLLAGSEEFAVLLEGIRSSDGAVLYSGTDTVTVTSSGGATPVPVPVSYVGPCGLGSGCTVTVAPQDTTIAQGGSFVMRVSVDSLGVSVAGVPVALTNLSPALITVGSNRTVTALTGTAGGPARVVAAIHGTADTLRLFVTAPTGNPAVVIVTPGVATLALGGAGSTVQLADTVKDANGNLLAPSLAAWVSRTPGVATVSSAGLVTAVARGSAVIVATAGTGVADSIVVAVGDATTAPGDPLVLALTGGNRAFGTARVGTPVPVDVTVDLKAVPTDKLGSYTARYTWNTAALRFDSTTAGTFAAPTVNTDSTAFGVVRFAAVDANGAAGAPVLVRLWFTATAAGADGHQLEITEMSATSPTYDSFTNLGRLIVASGGATIKP